MVEIVIKISGNSKDFRKELDRIERESDKTTKELDRDGEKLTRESKKESEKRIVQSKRESQARIRNAKRVAAVIAVIAAASITASIVEFARFEKALAGVSKTTDIVGKDLQDLGDEIGQVAIKTGISTDVLLGIAQSAGQLGVTGSKNILKFTDTIAKLGTASNLSGEAAATTLARLLSITKENVEDVDRLASVIVRLGNNFAATESEIANTATEIASAGVQFGVTTTQAAGLAAAFAELAIQPELARSTITRSFIEIDKAIRGGGKELLSLISITGMTEEQLRSTFKDNAVEVFQSFLGGLKRIQQGGGNTTKALEGLNLQGIRLLASLPKLAQGSDVVADALSQAADEFDRNTALTKEFGVQLDTTVGRANQLKEELAKTKREIGEGFLPVTEKTIESLKELAPVISDVLVPAIVATIGFVTDLTTGMVKLTNSIKLFLTLPINRPFADVRDLVKDTNNELTILGENLEKLPETTIFGFSTESVEGSLIEETLANQRAVIAEHFEQVAALEEETRIARLEKEETDRAARLAAELQEIKDREKANKAARKAELKAVKQAEKQLEAAKEARVKAEITLDQAIVDSSFAALNAIVGDNKAARTILFLAEKATAIGRILINAQAAAALAIATVPPPFGEAIAAKRIAAGTASAATVAVLAVPELIGNLKGAVGGTVVSGGVRGRDTEPFLLARDEIVLPSRANPLSPDFEEAFGGGGSQTVEVVIDLTEEASQFITVGQREDTTLGVQT